MAGFETTSAATRENVSVAVERERIRTHVLYWFEGVPEMARALRRLGAGHVFPLRKGPALLYKLAAQARSYIELERRGKDAYRL
jgi:hypothetical protein